MSTAKRWVHHLGSVIHFLHGSYGIFAGATLFLILAWAEPALPRGTDLLLFVGPLFLILAIGLITLPREGVAAQQRAVAVLSSPDGPQVMARRLIWPIALCILLAPRIFLAAYGVPHLNPLTGVITPGVQLRLTVTFLFGVLLVPALYLRASRRYAPQIKTSRPSELEQNDFTHTQRDLLLAMTGLLLIAWAWLLRPFWFPFSLFGWPPSLASLHEGARGVGSVAFALIIPAMLWMSLAAHLGTLWTVGRGGTWSEHRRCVMLAALHIGFIVFAIVLHIYDLLWIAQYRRAVGF